MRAQRAFLETLRRRPRPRVTLWEILALINNWGSWALTVVLVTSQLTCIVWNTLVSTQYMLYGQPPTRGPFAIEGLNDEPYSDRSVVCVQQGRLYRPMQLSAALASASARVVDTTGTFVGGYRVVSRHEMTLRDEIATRYTLACSTLAATLDGILTTCRALGYEPVERESFLHVVDGVFSNTTTQLPHSLPVLILPYWDNAIYARYAVPGLDGSACVFRLSGQFDDASASGAALDAVNRSVREAKTVEWLGVQDHALAWRNGWLEDATTRMRWYSDLLSTAQHDDKYGMLRRHFDVGHAGGGSKELDCSRDVTACLPTAVVERWGAKFASRDQQLWYHSVAVSNGSRFGLFLYEAVQERTVLSIYDLATLISNTTVLLLLARWLVVSLALARGFWLGRTRRLASSGLSCLSCTRSFELLPVLLLPRLSTSLAAFFSAGLKFEGEQRPFAEAWFAIYPALAETLLFLYACLNLLAKLLALRVRDALFGPSLALVCLLHLLRAELGASGLLGIDGRVASLVTAREVERVTLLDWLGSPLALRVGARVDALLALKLALLALNVLLPLATAQRVRRRPWNCDKQLNLDENDNATTVERALGVRASESAGLGRLLRLEKEEEKKKMVVDAAEVARLGFVVAGGAALVGVGEWLAAAATRRVVAWRVEKRRVGAMQAASGVATDVAAMDLE